MRKYQIVNFAGIPYGKPHEMKEGRLDYMQRQLAKNNVWASSNQEHVAVFKDLPLAHQHLRQLRSMLSDISTNDPLAALHCEQVIGRVLRILNRPENPNEYQIHEYHRNLEETLKLAEHLSRYDFNWRRLGRILMAVAMCALVASVLAFVFVSAPVSFALAGSAVFLGAVGWYLNRFSLANLEEVVTDFVHNVEDFSNRNVTQFDSRQVSSHIELDDLNKQAGSIIETTALYGVTHLDPLGSENPEEALRQAEAEMEFFAYYDGAQEEKTYVQQASETLSGWGRSIYSLFSSNTASRAVPRETEEALLSEEGVPDWIQC